MAFADVRAADDEGILRLNRIADVGQSRNRRKRNDGRCPGCYHWIGKWNVLWIGNRPPFSLELSHQLLMARRADIVDLVANAKRSRAFLDRQSQSTNVAGRCGLLHDPSAKRRRNRLAIERRESWSA